MKTGAHILIRLLQSHGVKFIFGVTGTGMTELQDEMVTEKPPKWIQGLHEFVTVNAAAGYALVSETPGVALVDRTVGVQNSVGAVYSAYMNSTPLILLASENIPGLPIPSGEPQLHYANNMNSINTIWTKWNSKVSSLETMGNDIDTLFQHTLSEPQAPTFLTLRQDLMASESNTPVRLSKNFGSISYRVPEDEVCADIVNKVLESENPSIVTSHIGRHKSFVQPLISFSSLMGITVFEKRFFMNYPLENKLHGGFLHRYKEPDLSKKTDLLMAIDIGLLPHQKFGKNIKLIELSGDEFNREYVYAGGDYGSSLQDTVISGNFDSGPTLRKLDKIARHMIGNTEKESITDRISKITDAHKKMIEDIDKKSVEHYNNGVISDFSVGRIMNRYWNEKFIWVNGTTTYNDGLIKTIRLTEPGSYFGNPSGHLGVTIGMAYGAALANKSYEEVKDYGGYKKGAIVGENRVTVCTTGDGDAIFGNIDSALWTVSHYGIGVIYIIFNNSFWEAEYPPFQETKYKNVVKTKDYEFMDLRDPNIDFSQIAKAFSVDSAKATTLEEFEEAFQLAIKFASSGHPYLIDLRIPTKSASGESTVT